MKACVIWYDTDNPLYLTSLRLNEDGTVKSGWVVNGLWNFEIRDGECLAKEGNRIVNRWPAPEQMPVVEVTDDVRGGYNEVIEWAEKQLNQS